MLGDHLSDFALRNRQIFRCLLDRDRLYAGRAHSKMLPQSVDFVSYFGYIV